MLPEIRNEEHLFSIPKFTVSGDDVKNFMDKQGGEPHGRLVQEDQLGLGHQGAADHGHLLFSPADKAGDFIPLLSQPGKVVIDHFESRLDGPAAAP